MKLDAALPIVQLKDVPAIAKAAQEIGFDALWTQETQHDPFLPCTLIAEHTQKLNFGTAIAVSFARSPANLALDLAGTREFPERARLQKFVRQVTGMTAKAAQRLLDQVDIGIDVALQHAADYGRRHADAARFVERISGVMQAGLKRLRS